MQEQYNIVSVYIYIYIYIKGAFVGAMTEQLNSKK